MRTWMRWGACAVGVGLGLVPMTGRAEEHEKSEASPKVGRTLVTAQPVSGQTGLMGVGVEQVVGSHVALAGAAQVVLWLAGSESTHFQAAGFSQAASFSSRQWGVGVDSGVHFYFSGRAPEGFWVGPHLEMSMTRSSFENQYTLQEGGQVLTYETRSRSVQYGGSVRLGYTAIVAPGLALQVGVGLGALAGRHTPFAPKASEGQPVQIGGLSDGRSWSVSPRMSVGLGWAF